MLLKEGLIKWRLVSVHPMQKSFRLGVKFCVSEIRQSQEVAPYWRAQAAG